MLRGTKRTRIPLFARGRGWVGFVGSVAWLGVSFALPYWLIMLGNAVIMLWILMNLDVVPRAFGFGNRNMSLLLAGSVCVAATAMSQFTQLISPSDCGWIETAWSPRYACLNGPPAPWILLAPFILILIASAYGAAWAARRTKPDQQTGPWYDFLRYYPKEPGIRSRGDVGAVLWLSMSLILTLMSVLLAAVLSLSPVILVFVTLLAVVAAPGQPSWQAIGRRLSALGDGVIVAETMALFRHGIKGFLIGFCIASAALFLGAVVIGGGDHSGWMPVLLAPILLHFLQYGSRLATRAAGAMRKETEGVVALHWVSHLTVGATIVALSLAMYQSGETYIEGVFPPWSIAGFADSIGWWPWSLLAMLATIDMVVVERRHRTTKEHRLQMIQVLAYLWISSIPIIAFLSGQGATRQAIGVTLIALLAGGAVAAFDWLAPLAKAEAREAVGGAAIIKTLRTPPKRVATIALFLSGTFMMAMSVFAGALGMLISIVRSPEVAYWTGFLGQDWLAGPTSGTGWLFTLAIFLLTAAMVSVALNPEVEIRVNPSHLVVNRLMGTRRYRLANLQEMSLDTLSLRKLWGHEVYPGNWSGPALRLEFSHQFMFPSGIREGKLVEKPIGAPEPRTVFISSTNTAELERAITRLAAKTRKKELDTTTR